MASRDIKDLTPVMQEKAQFVIKYCADKGYPVLIYCTKRDLQEQAILFRSSDPTGDEVKEKIEDLRNRGFGFLADIIKEVGPQPYHGWKTDAAPGESFHGYLEAFDAAPIIGGKIPWQYEDNPKAWDIYGEAVKAAGLTWGGDWKRKDLPHAQLRSGGNPLNMYSPEEIKRILQENGVLKV